MFVLGCHRSGTSYLASVIYKSLNDCELIDEFPDKWVGVSEGNRKGHYESKYIKHLNNKLLSIYGTSWDCPPLGIFDHSLLNDQLKIDDERKNLKGYSINKRWIDKDPRLCLTIDLLYRILLRDPLKLMTIRNPLSVANSLYARDGFPHEKSLAMWLVYNRSIFKAVAKPPSWIHVYEKSIEESKLSASKISLLIKNYLKLTDEEGEMLLSSLESNFLLNWSDTDQRSDISLGTKQQKPIYADCFKIYSIIANDIIIREKPQELMNLFDKAYVNNISTLEKLFLIKPRQANKSKEIELGDIFNSIYRIEDLVCKIDDNSQKIKESISLDGSSSSFTKFISTKLLLLFKKLRSLISR